jgi:O-methyltransferase
MEKEFLAIYEICNAYTMTGIQRMYSLYKAVKHIISTKVQGDFIECGVWKGGSSMIMAYTLLQMEETERKIFLYDTFKGMPKPTEIDKKIHSSQLAIDKWEQCQQDNYNKWCFSPLDEVKKNMLSTGYPLYNFIFVEGKVEDTIPEILPSKIALLRLDTDWYESTYHELTHLLPILTEGGILIIDDYWSWAGAKKAVDQYFTENNIGFLLNYIDNTGRIDIKKDPVT